MQDYKRFRHQNPENSFTFQLLALISWQQPDVFYFTGMEFCFQVEIDGLLVEQTRPHHSDTCITCLGLKVLSFQALDEDTGLGMLEIRDLLGNPRYINFPQILGSRS